jgi:hypothetical protein
MSSGGMKELEKYLLQQCKDLCEMASIEVFEAINFFLNQYYSEWSPSYYQRSYDLLHSAFKTEVKKVGNGYQAVVGIDYESLDNYENASGWQIVDWSNKGLHGNLDVGTDTRIFDDSINSTITSGQLLKDCIVFLKSKGLTVIT